MTEIPTEEGKLYLAVVLAWRHEFYNTRRRHSSAAMMSPIDYENDDASAAARAGEQAA